MDRFFAGDVRDGSPRTPKSRVLLEFYAKGPLQICQGAKEPLQICQGASTNQAVEIGFFLEFSVFCGLPRPHVGRCGLRGLKLKPSTETLPCLSQTGESFLLTVTFSESLRHSDFPILLYDMQAAPGGVKASAPTHECHLEVKGNVECPGRLKTPLWIAKASHGGQHGGHTAPERMTGDAARRPRTPRSRPGCRESQERRLEWTLHIPSLNDGVIDFF